MDMYINLQVLATWLGAFTIIGTFVFGGIKLIDKHFLKRITMLEQEYKKLNSWSSKQQSDIARNAEARQLLVEGQMVCLEKLKENGANGCVTDIIKKLKAFLFRSVGETRSTH